MSMIGHHRKAYKSKVSTEEKIVTGLLPGRGDAHGSAREIYLCRTKNDEKSGQYNVNNSHMKRVT